jgi:hypothetical protein
MRGALWYILGDYERGTPVVVDSTVSRLVVGSIPSRLQGYLAYEKQRPPRTLQ